jgi:DNA mismatch repair protein MutL
LKYRLLQQLSISRKECKYMNIQISREADLLLCSIYEEYLKKLQKAPVMMDLLVPVTLHVSDDIVQRVDEINAALSKIHLSFEAFGKDTLLVRSLPSWMNGMNQEKFLQDVLDLYKSEMMTDIARMQYGSLASLASGNAVHKVQSLSMDEMNTIIEKLAQCENPYYGNNGIPVFMILDEKELTKGLAK